MQPEHPELVFLDFCGERPASARDTVTVALTVECAAAGIVRLPQQ